MTKSSSLKKTKQQSPACKTSRRRAQTKSADGDAASVERKERMKKILKALAKLYPQAECELDVATPLEVLVATVLSAQCTDKKVNQVTPALFEKYPNPQSYAKAKVSDVEKIIRTLGLFRAKAKSLVAAGKMLVEEFGAEVPDTLDELVKLPGVGRKTANCVLVNGFNKPGIMCDTHCCRLSLRLGLTESKDPVHVEFDLAKLMAPKDWGLFSHRIILHGRRVCHARKPECGRCSMNGFCPSASAGDDRAG